MAGLCNVTIFNVLFLIRCVVQTARFTTIQFNRKLVEHTIQTEDVGKYQIEVTIPTFMEINRRETKKSERNSTEKKQNSLRVTTD